MPKAKDVIRIGDFGGCCTRGLYAASGIFNRRLLAAVTDREEI